MAWYNPDGKCAEVLRKARGGRLELYAPDTVKDEIIKVFKRRNLSDVEINEFLDDFSMNWIDENIYQRFISETKVKHKPDKPIEAVAIFLDCKILSADEDFKNSERRIDIDELLRRFGE